MLKVVHTKRCKDKDAVLIDRQSIFGNPFRIGRDGDRAEVIDLFESYFRRRLIKDPSFRSAVLRLKDFNTLKCWCSPLPCHGDVIARLLDSGFVDLVENMSALGYGPTQINYAWEDALGYRQGKDTL